MAGTLVIDTLKSSTSGPPAFQNTSGTEVGQLCRAWVNFNGVSTATIRASFNVSSVTRNAAGDYTVNFATAMPDANYSVQASAASPSAASYMVVNTNTNGSSSAVAPTASSMRMMVGAPGSAADSPYVNVAIFR